MAFLQTRRCLVGLFCLLLASCASEMKRGSDKSIYTIADTMEVFRSDIGKNIQLRLDQKLFFKMENDPDQPGKWELIEHDRRTLLLLSTSPRTAPGVWGILLQARALGSGSVKLRFTPADETKTPQEILFETEIRR